MSIVRVYVGHRLEVLVGIRRNGIVVKRQKEMLNVYICITIIELFNKGEGKSFDIFGTRSQGSEKQPPRDCDFYGKNNIFVA